MSEEDAFMLVIRANPDDDTPRLVYADWLQERGQPDRAEFIRVQIALHKWRNGGLSRRERELFDSNGVNQREWMGDAAHSCCKLSSPWADHLKWFDRGFVERVECPAGDWIAHGDAVLAQQPVRRVKLTMLPSAEARTFNALRRWKRPLEWGGDLRDSIAAEWPRVVFAFPGERFDDLNGLLRRLRLARPNRRRR